MRPVEKLANPSIAYSSYVSELKKQIGKYCSYCELRVPALAGEHILPVKHYPELEKDWDNLLLGCINCNSCKGDNKIVLLDYFWPHLHNTFKIFNYHRNGNISVNQLELSADDCQKADRTLKLLGLNNPNTDTNERKLRRHRAFLKAEIEKNALSMLQQNANENDILDKKNAIVNYATLDYGCFSIWLTVFNDDPAMKSRLIAAFPGTCPKSFDANGDAIPRK